MNDAFEKYHPLVNFLYFAFVLGFSMTIYHPLAQLISLFCGIGYAVQCEGRKAVEFCLKYSMPMMMFTAFINPAFNHAGVTILTYLPTGNPLTLESILYGFAAGGMLANALIWFLNFNRVISTDKFVYLFGRIAPALSLVLSMILRFVPRFKKQIDTVSQVHSCINNADTNTGFIKKIKSAVMVLSAVITWALENSIETADSMKSRGYGLAKRTAFSIYRFEKRDKKAISWIAFCGLYTVAGTAASAFGFDYIPAIRYAPLNIYTANFYCVYLCLCAMPVLLNATEKKNEKIFIQ